MVGLGGALGTMARYGVWRALPNQPGSFTVATFAVNVIGSFVLGLLVGLLFGRLTMRVQALFFVGVLGGFTTFSTFTVDTVALFRAGAGTTAVLNVVLSVGVGLVVAAAGIYLGESLNPEV